MNAIEEIKYRGSIIDLVSYLGIKFEGSNVIRSIYKTDNNASLHLYPNTNSFYCFATNQGGDLIKFYQDFKGIDIREAVKDLSEWLNIGNITTYRETKPKAEFKTIQNNEIDLLIWEREFFEERKYILEVETELNQDQIKSSIYQMILDQRKEIQSKIFESLYYFNKEKGLDELIYNYLIGSERGLCENTIEHFKLFSIHSIKENFEFLKDSFCKEDLIISGLFKNKYFLFSKHRLIIPYIEAGKITYLRGRYFYEGEFKPNNFGKYIGLNNWSNTLSPKRFFNIDILKDLKPNNDIVISEGEFDCMISNQNQISSLGIAGVSNFPKNQIHLLDKYNIYLAFDSDEAGEKAVIEISNYFNKPIKQIVLKNHKDLTELLK